MNSWLGGNYLGNGSAFFEVWAPQAKSVEVHLLTPREQFVPLAKNEKGYFRATVQGVEKGSLYRYRLDGQKSFPDPASKSQPQGVHGPSQVVDPDFDWKDRSWRGIPLQESIFYEIHVGTFTKEGTFEAIIPELARLKELGITTLEIMPIAQFPGERNWGYDGVFPYAPQQSYGGVAGFKKLVDSCHRQGLAVVLDVVYNHLGPEGNYLGEYGPYFTEFYKTPWGAAINYDGAFSDEVRRFFLENVAYWIEEFHLDGLRLDAVHAICDFSATPFLAELSLKVDRIAERLGRSIRLIAESDLNDHRMLRKRDCDGYQMDTQWNDDFHHSLHTLLTQESRGYYEDFGKLSLLARCYEQGWAYQGDYSPHRKRRHGNAPKLRSGSQLVVYAQNHDQIGNRVQGDRLTAQLDFEELKLAASVVLLSPYLPLLFMGEEYGEPAPFPYFVSHSDPKLNEAVRLGRKKEFADFAWEGQTPDPCALPTFESAKINVRLIGLPPHRALFQFYQRLIQLRKQHGLVRDFEDDRLSIQVYEKEGIMLVHRHCPQKNLKTLTCFHFGDRARNFSFGLPSGEWKTVLDSADPIWQGPCQQIPPQFSSNSSASIELAPSSALFLVRMEKIL